MAKRVRRTPGLLVRRMWAVKLTDNEGEQRIYSVHATESAAAAARCRRQDQVVPVDVHEVHDHG